MLCSRGIVAASSGGMSRDAAKKIIRDAALAEGPLAGRVVTDVLDQFADEDAVVSAAIAVLSYKDAYDVFAAAMRKNAR